MVVVGRQAELVARALNVEVVRKAVVAALAGATEGAEHVQLIVVRRVVIEVQGHVDVGTRGSATPLPPATGVALTARTTADGLRPTAPAAAAARLRGEVVLQLQLHRIRTAVVRGGAVIVARRALQRRRRVEL